MLKGNIGNLAWSCLSTQKLYPSSLHSKHVVRIWGFEQLPLTTRWPAHFGFVLRGWNQGAIIGICNTGGVHSKTMHGNYSDQLPYPLVLFEKTYWCLTQGMREWSISSLVIIIPAIPSNPSIPYVKRTSKKNCPLPLQSGSTQSIASYARLQEVPGADSTWECSWDYEFFSYIMERSTILNGKTHYFDWAMFNSKL